MTRSGAVGGVLAVALTLLAACGSSGKGKDGSDGATGPDGAGAGDASDGPGDGAGGDALAAAVAMDRLGSELGAAFCTKIYQCCGDMEILQLLGPRIKMSNCPILIPVLLTSSMVEVTYAVSENHVSYRGDRVPACLADFARRSCPDFARILAANSIPFTAQPLPSINLGIFECPQMLEPRQQPGQLCEADYECLASDCRGSATGDRRCRARSKENEACGPSADCEAGLVCAGAICRRRAASGESCALSTERGFCQDGLYCALDSATGDRQCRAQLADGAPCTMPAGNECKSGRCDPAPQAPGTYRCGPAAPPPPEALRCSGR